MQARGMRRDLIPGEHRPPPPLSLRLEAPLLPLPDPRPGDQRSQIPIPLGSPRQQGDRMANLPSYAPLLRSDRTRRSESDVELGADDRAERMLAVGTGGVGMAGDEATPRTPDRRPCLEGEANDAAEIRGIGDPERLVTE